MKFLLDANIPYSAKEIFSRTDEVVHVRDVGLSKVADAEIITFALQAKSVIITRDLDFANTILHPITTHYGVVVFRVPSYFKRQHLLTLLRLFLLKVKREALIKRLTILEPGRYRMRR